MSLHAPSTKDTTLWIAQLPVAQLLYRQRHHLLHQVCRGLGIAHVTQAVAARARSKQTVKLGLGVPRFTGRRPGNAPRNSSLRAFDCGRVQGFHVNSIANPGA